MAINKFGLANSVIIQMLFRLKRKKNQSQKLLAISWKLLQIKLQPHLAKKKNSRLLNNKEVTKIYQLYLASMFLVACVHLLIDKAKCLSK